MIEIFSKNHVTILRKKGDEYIQEQICTDTFLPCSPISAEENRRNVIARLRKDPSVFLVLEPKDGRCEEEAVHSSGFTFHVEVAEGEKPTADLRVTYKNSLAYEKHFPDKNDFEDEEIQFDPVWTILGEVCELLTDIQYGFYGFVLDSCPYFVPDEPAEPVDIYGIRDILSREGFQTERISVIGGVAEPLLIVHENDVILIGSRHFDGKRLFVEMKRFFSYADTKTIEDAAARVSESQYGIKVIHWEDRSWSFRMFLDDEVDEKNFLDRLDSAISQIRTFVNLVEDQDSVGKEPWNIISEQRHFFIHETLTESGKLSKLLI